MSFLARLHKLAPAAASAQRRLLHTSLPALQADSDKLFDKILIANRGEIACRVMRTCKKLGIETVAVHSDVDTSALHARTADERVLLGAAPSSESYLNMDKIIRAVTDTGAQAVHPGYGFLSENTAFAQRLEDIGVKFIGPRSHAIHVMGDKLESKQLAKNAGVNVIPGYEGVVEDEEHALSIANEIGYPVMIKASAGGGGKGMRVAWNDKQTREGFRLSKQEAKSSFGDDRILIEKFIDNPRHIEIQVLADSHGNTIYLNERECSIQRRNQKVIEEAPSTFLDEATRKAMGEQACQLAKACQYESAGTVEFLVDSQRNFYFLEMNTRLQVEHPITELITGVDLVEQMIRVAAGQQLQLTQNDIGINGWAFESRVYAEDPCKMLPSTGRLETYIEPEEVPGVRVDTGVFEGSEISIYYDPMISKLSTHGATREEALDRMRVALDSYVIKGLRHNIPLLRDIIRHPRFVTGDISTKFIQEVYPDGFQGYELDDTERKNLLASAAFMYIKRQLISQRFYDERVLSESQFYASNLAVTLNGQVYHVDVNLVDENRLTVSIDDGEPVEIDADWALGEPKLLANIDDSDIVVQYLGRDGQTLRLVYCGTEYDVVVRLKKEQRYFDKFPPKPKRNMADFVQTPMPGTLISLSVKEGEKVLEGVEVAVVEAMKMQNQLLAPRSGIVKKVHAEVGAGLSEGQLIIEFEKEESAEAEQA